MKSISSSLDMIIYEEVASLGPVSFEHLVEYCKQQYTGEWFCIATVDAEVQHAINRNIGRGIIDVKYDADEDKRHYFPRVPKSQQPIRIN